MADLYRIDYHKWLGQQRELLARRQFEQLDIENLLEAMEYEMGNPAETLESYLSVLVLHLLKYDYQIRILKDPWIEDRVAHLWKVSVINARSKVKKQISKHPHLQSITGESLAEAYLDAKKDAVKEMNVHARSEAQRLNNNSFPKECPWTFDQIMTEDWLPETDNG